MAALRKMLGSLEDPSVIALMRLIETQSKPTLTAWAAHAVREGMLPLLDSADERPLAAIDAAEAFARGERSLMEVKPVLTEARKAAQELNATPVQQAAARAIGTACATAITPTNALGFTFYYAAAAAYHQVGTGADAATYDALASEIVAGLLASLHACAAVDEPNPVKVDWGC